MTREQIIADAENMATAQLAALAGKPPVVDWVGAAMWAGYADLSHVAGNAAARQAVEQVGQAVQWTPIFSKNKPYFADDLCIGQVFLDLYAAKKDPEILAPTRTRLDAVADYILTKEPDDDPASSANQLTWWWCDALFMAPPVHARLTEITHDPKYLEAMDKEWWRTAALLYDPQEHLFFRDKRFLHALTKHGKKMFWSRGNGWVFAGLARTLEHMPRDFPTRPKYAEVFSQMAAKLADLQQPDGTWRPSLLDPEEFPDSEASGTALDCFAFAWGINHGLLDRKTYLPVATKAWAALLAARRPDGLLGYVQGVADRPKRVSADGTRFYATGAFLMAATQLAPLAPFELPPSPALTAEP